MRVGWRQIALLVALAASACDAPKPPKPATQAVESQSPAEAAPKVLEQVPSDGSDGFAVKLASGQWCTGGPGYVHFNGNAKLCSSIHTAGIRIDPEMGAPNRLATLKMTYHQPGPQTDAGDGVVWNATSLRVDCESRQIWALSITTYGEADRELMREVANPPRQMPSPDAVLVGLVCDPAL